MSEPPAESESEIVTTSPELTALTTVLNKVRPTVVVRRRVYEVAREQAPSPGFVAVEDDDDEAGPPSSVNVARALASLRGDELRRLEEILAESESETTEVPALSEIPLGGEMPADPPSDPAAVKTVPVASTITVSELSKRLGVPTSDLVTTLVAAGYFSTTAKSTLTRADATTAAWMFGFTVEPVSDESEPARKKSGASKKKK